MKRSNATQSLVKSCVNPACRFFKPWIFTNPNISFYSQSSVSLQSWHLDLVSPNKSDRRIRYRLGEIVLGDNLEIEIERRIDREKMDLFAILSSFSCKTTRCDKCHWEEIFIKEETLLAKLLAKFLTFLSNSRQYLLAKMYFLFLEEARESKNTHDRKVSCSFSQICAAPRCNNYKFLSLL